MRTKTDKSSSIHQRDKVKKELSIKELNWTQRQQEIINIALNNQTKVVFISAPAGAAKTILAVYSCLRLLVDKKISDILYVRSAVEVGKKIGFLPGDSNDKLAPYNVPFYDKLSELLSKGDVEYLKKDNRVSCLPINYARGLSLNVKGIIFDECIAGDEKIVTDNGIIKLETLYRESNINKKPFNIKTFNESTQAFEYKPLKKIWSNGIKEVINVKAGNRNIRCTDNHKFLTSTGWKEAKHLKKGDILIANNTDKHQVLRCLNEDQEQILLGSFLGDGSISNHGINRNRLRIIHGIKQADYCLWKASMFGSKSINIEKNGYSQKPAIKFNTKCFSFNQEFNHDKKYTCPDWIIDKLDWRGIAIWYMDDGTLFKNKNGINLYTCSFDYNTQQKFIEKFKSLGIECKCVEYKKNNKIYYILNINNENTKKFLFNVSKYMHDNLSYKTLDSYLTNEYEWNNKYLNYNHIVCDGVEYNKESVEVFDLEVEDNHNFIICSHNNESGVVVHNCQNSTSEEIFTIMTRMGPYSRLFILADTDQSDLPQHSQGDFNQIFNLFSDEESKKQGITTISLTEEDIMRSELVKFVVSRKKLFTK